MSPHHGIDICWQKIEGRPKVGASNIGVRVPPDQLAPLDAWIAVQPDPKPSRPEAIRAILADRLSEQPPAAAQPATSDGLSEDEGRMMRSIRDQGTDELCRLLNEMREWPRTLFLCALSGADIDDVLRRYDRKRTMP